VRRELKRHNIKDILDLGCGVGDDIFCLNSKYGVEYDLTFSGVDKNAEKIEFCEARKNFRGDENVRFYVGDVAKLGSKDSSYDLVICSEVIEHLTRPLDAIKEIKRVLKNSGVAIVSTPNKSNPMMRVRKSLCFLKPLEAECKSRPNDGHISVSGLKTWIRIFKDEGFEVERICRGSLLFGGNQIDSPRFIFLIALLFDIVFDFLPFAKNWSENIIFCLRKR
jgi:SAM-dependent methyltransferase